MEYTEAECVSIDYVPNNCEEVIFKTDGTDDEYRILDISSKNSGPNFQETSNYAEEDQGDYSDDGDNDEDRGVLKHAWQDENPDIASDEEEDDANSELKSSLSNIVKFINFLNKLQEDHHQFVNSDIVQNEQIIEEQKQAVAINTYMISDLVKLNFGQTNTTVNEIVHELKKVLAVKVELFDKLLDKQVNGVVSQDVVKRLFSGNNLLIKTQIDELRRILFTKLDAVNKMHILKKQKLKNLKRTARKKPMEKVKVFTPTPVKDNPLEKQKEKINKMEQKIHEHVENLNVKKSLIQEHIQKLLNSDLPGTEVDDSNVSGENSSQTSTLEDFNSFTEVITKKMKLKPEEASPSLILSTFRNNLNKKLHEGRADSVQEEDQVSIIELGLDDFKDEEHLVEEIFYDDVFPESFSKSFSSGWGENYTIQDMTSEAGKGDTNEQDDSSYIIQDLTEYNKPVAAPTNEVVSYSINDVTITKLPYAVNQKISAPSEQIIPSGNQKSVSEIEKTFLKNREKAIWQLNHMVDPASADKSVRNKFLKNLNKSTEPVDTPNTRRVIQTYLENKLSELETKKQLARESLELLNESKRLTNKEFGVKNIPDAMPVKEYTGKPYLLDKKSNGTPQNYVTVKLSPSQTLKETKSEQLKVSSILNKKLKELFKNNNLKGNLMKRKLVNCDKDIQDNEENLSQKKIKVESIENEPNSDLDDEFESLSDTKTKSKVLLDEWKLFDTQNEVKSTKLNFSKKDGTKNKTGIQKVQEVRLGRSVLVDSRKSAKKPLALVLPGESSKLMLLKGATPFHRIEAKNKIKGKQKQSNSNEFEKSDSKSKKLLDNLKQQIFNKLHKQDSIKRAAEVKLEIEKRLRRKEKLKAWQKNSSK